MSVRFILGRAGSGKSRYCFDAIVEALRQAPLGDPILFLLPRQATFTAERLLACASGLKGFCRLRVESFDGLAHGLMAECGGAAIPQVTTLGRQMILGHLLRKNQPRLKYFSKVAMYPSLAARLETALTELDRCGTDPGKLQSALAGFTDDEERAIDSQLFSAKLHDLQLMFQAYCDYLGQERLDPRRRMEHLLGCIDGSSRISRATIYVDEFLDLTDLERRMLARLAKRARRVEITLLMDPKSPLVGNPERVPDELSLFHRTECTYNRLMQALAAESVAPDDPLILKASSRSKSSSLKTIETCFFAMSGSRTTDESIESIQLVEAPDRRAEVEAAARHIRFLVSTGHRLRDIALLVRRLDDYVDLLQSTLQEHQIPFFVDHRRTMAHHPLLQLIRSILRIALKSWPHDSVMQLIKTGLADISLTDADHLENYVLEHRLRGDVWSRDEPWTWCRRMSRGGDDGTSAAADPSPAMDALRRRICDAFAPFTSAFPKGSTSAPIREIATGLFQLLGRLNVRLSLWGWIEDCRRDDQHERAAEHEQIWTEVSGLFQQMVELLGNERVTLEEFSQIVEAGLETFDLALAPPTADQVLVGAIDRSRTPPLKAVLLLGWSDGLFPSTARDLSILTDSERGELTRRHVPVEPDTDRQRLDEDLLAYIALTRASESLYISRPVCDEARRPCAPSPYWLRLRTLFPNIRTTILPRDEKRDPTLIGTPRQLLTSLLSWARAGGDTAAQPWPSLYQWLSTYPPRDDSIDSIRFRAWKSLSYDNRSSLSSAHAGKLFAAPLRASVSQVEVFATCPFRHFLRYGLGLELRSEEGHLAINLDNAFHAILQNLVSEMLRRRLDWSKLSAGEAQKLVETYTQQISQTLAGEMMLSNARNRYLLARIQHTIEQLIAQQREMSGRSELKTSHSNLNFGSANSPLPALVLKTPSGKEIHLRGQIDRVDILEKQAAFAILDYRLFGDSLNLTRVRHGLSLQLLASLAIVEEHSQRLTNKKLVPAAAFYLRLLRQLEKVDHPDDATAPDDPIFHLAAKPRGIFNTDYFDALDNSCPSGAASEVLSARVKQDGTFGYRNSTDVADPKEFAALLKEVRRQLATLADEIIAGEVGIRPYRIGTSTPCSSCNYRSVCRFDASINRYRNIQGQQRHHVLEQLAAEAPDE